MLCVATAGTIAALTVSGFTLGWTHSVERTRWLETWVIEGDAMRLASASVEGSGAGIALPDDAIWTDGRWTYEPDLPALRSLDLASSGLTPSPWTFCPMDEPCVSLGGKAGDEVRIWVDTICVTGNADRSAANAVHFGGSAYE